MSVTGWGRILLLGMAWLLVAAEPVIAQQRMYRYIDDRGIIVLDDHVPPDFVHHGYTILGPGGRVIEEVPPSLNPEEAAARREARVEAERQRHRDESLLRRYSTVADIEAARERALNEINVRLEILRSNLLSLKAQIEREQSRAADLERRGVAVPESLTETLRTLQHDVGDTENTIRQRHRDADQVRAGYQRDIERFEVLLERLQRSR